MVFFKTCLECIAVTIKGLDVKIWNYVKKSEICKSSRNENILIKLDRFIMVNLFFFYRLNLDHFFSF